MKEFFIGLLVLLVLLLLSLVGIFLLPVIVVLGFSLRWLIAIILLMGAIWLVGKVTLFVIDYLKKKEMERSG